MTGPSSTRSLAGAADEDRARAEEGRHEERTRLLVEIVGLADLDEPSAVHDGDPPPELEGFLLVVRDEDRRDAERLLDLLERLAKLHADLDVERAERLVEQEDRRPVRESAREGDPLPLAPRELALVAAAEAREADELQQLLAALLPLGRRDLADAQSELDVLGDGHVPEDRVVLEDEADVPRLGRQVRHVLLAETDDPLVRQDQAGDHPEDRALAAARRAEQHEKLAVLDLERHAVDGDLVGEALADLLEGDRHQRSRLAV